LLRVAAESFEFFVQGPKGRNKLVKIQNILSFPLPLLVKTPKPAFGKPDLPMNKTEFPAKIICRNSDFYLMYLKNIHSFSRRGWNSAILCTLGKGINRSIMFTNIIAYSQ